MKVAFSTAEYPLKNSAILDSGSTTHIFNKRSRFTNFKKALPGDHVWAGEQPVLIQGYGNVAIPLDSPKSTYVLQLFDIAYCPGFAYNLVSYRLLRRRRYW